MNFRRLSDKELADFAANVLSLLGGTQLKSIDTSVRTKLVTALGTLPVDLSTQTATAGVAEGVRKAAVSSKNTMRFQITAIMAQVKTALLAGVAPKEQYDLCGFDSRSPVIGPYVPADPTELSAFGYSNAINIIKWRGNNRSGSVVYELWRRQGDTGAWALLATTKKQTFTDAPVTPGQYYEYKARARASKTISHFSNSAIVYGV